MRERPAETQVTQVVEVRALAADDFGMRFSRTRWCRVVVVLVACVALASVAGVSSAQDGAERLNAATPVIVGERGFTAGELRAAEPGWPRERSTRETRRQAATALTLDAWDALEAQERGLVVPEAAVDVAMSEALRQAALLGDFADPTPPERLRIELAAGIRRELIIDAIVREAGPGPRAFGRAFDATGARHRAVTFCRAAYADPSWNSCANRPWRTGACTIVGVPVICSYNQHPRDWSVESNVLTDFYDPPKASTEPDPNPGFDRLIAFLRSRSPGPYRRCFYEGDDANLSFICPSRADAIAVAYAITRIHQKAKKSWIVPATNGRL